MILFILGRQPRLGLAELEAIFGNEAIIPYGSQAAIGHISTEEALSHPIGSVMKIAKVLKTVPTDHWRNVAQKVIAELEPTLPLDKKVTLGLSAYGFSVTGREVQKTGIILKQRLKNRGGSLRLIPQNESILNTAQVLHNKLTNGTTKQEVVIAKGNRESVIATTISVQDIDAYTFRDRSRPKRDAKVGMLPPKLAQTMINLAGGNTPDSRRLLDPFCGTGVILQEAALMGYQVYGTDLESRMLEYSQANLEWLKATHHIELHATLEQADATSASWKSPIDLVACETYLGQPFSTAPSSDKLHDVMQTCNTIVRKFLVQLAPQLSPGTRLCVGVPVWFVKNHVHHLRMLDSLEEIGYNREDFIHASNEDLLYHREDQIVGRELLVLTRS